MFCLNMVFDIGGLGLVATLFTLPIASAKIGHHTGEQVYQTKAWQAHHKLDDKNDYLTMLRIIYVKDYSAFMQ